MYILKRKNKKETIYFLCKSYRDVNTGKNTSKIIERIGNEEEVKKKAGSKDIDVWLKEYANKRDEKKESISITFSTRPKTAKMSRIRLNAGYLVIKKILNDFKLDKICNYIKKEEKYTGNLIQVLYILIYDKVYYANDEFTFRRFLDKTLIENPTVTQIDLNRALRILAKHSYAIQSELFWSVNKKLKYDTSVIFNNCKNYLYNMKQAGKESMSLTQVDVFYDKNGIPLAAFNNSDNNVDLDKKRMVLDGFTYLDPDYKLAQFSDSLNSKMVDKLNLSPEDKISINNLNIRGLKKELQDWILNDELWNVLGSNKKYDINEIHNKPVNFNVTYFNLSTGKVYYKYCKINYKNSICTVIAIFSEDKKFKDRKERYEKYTKIRQLIDSNIDNLQNDKNKSNSIFTHVDRMLKNGINDDNLYEFKDSQLNKDIVFDGFELFVVNSSNDEFVENVVNMWTCNHSGTDTFSTIKHELATVPKVQNKHDFISIHLLVSLISELVIYYLNKENNFNFSNKTIIHFIEGFDFIKKAGIGWIPVEDHFKPHKIFEKILNINCNVEIIPDEVFRKLIKKLNKNR